MTTSSRIAVPALFIVSLLFTVLLAIPKTSFADCGVLNFLQTGKYCSSVVPTDVNPFWNLKSSPAPAPTRSGLIPSAQAAPAQTPATAPINNAYSYSTKDPGAPVIREATPIGDSGYSYWTKEPSAPPVQTAPTGINQVLQTYSTRAKNRQSAPQPEQLGGPVGTDNSPTTVSNTTFNRIVSSCGAENSPTSDSFQTCMTSSVPSGYDMSDFYGRMQQYVSNQSNPAAPASVTNPYDNSSDPGGFQLYLDSCDQKYGSGTYASNSCKEPILQEIGSAPAEWAPDNSYNNTATEFRSNAYDAYATEFTAKGTRAQSVPSFSTPDPNGPIPPPSGVDYGWSWCFFGRIGPGCAGSGEKTLVPDSSGGLTSVTVPSSKASQPFEDLSAISEGRYPAPTPQPLRDGWNLADPNYLTPDSPAPQPYSGNWYRADLNLLPDTAPGWLSQPSVPAYDDETMIQRYGNDADYGQFQPWFPAPDQGTEAPAVEPAQPEPRYVAPTLNAGDFNDNPYADMQVEKDTAFQFVQPPQQTVDSTGWQAFFDPSSWWPWGGDSGTEASNKPARQFSTAVPFSGDLVNKSLVASAFGAFLADPKK